MTAMTETQAVAARCGEHGEKLYVQGSTIGGASEFTCNHGCTLTWADLTDGEPGVYLFVRGYALLVQDVTDEAMESGRQRGYDHANYANAYGGAVQAEPKRDEIPLRYSNARSWFIAGWAAGVEAFADGQGRCAECGAVPLADGGCACI